jgi:glutamate synthase domain-containing protein 1
VIGWRDVPVDKDYVGITANYFAPYIKQLVIAASQNLAGDSEAFERKLYVIRRVAEKAAGPDLVIPSLSSRTIVYKGMLTAPQLLGYYPDLQNPRTQTALALVHSRFSTNTFPSWELAHPYRMIAHNGEINTLRGNVNWMRAASRSSPVSCSAPTSRRSCRSCAPAGLTPRRSTTCSSCSCSRAGRSRTR